MFGTYTKKEKLVFELIRMFCFVFAVGIFGPLFGDTTEDRSKDIVPTEEELVIPISKKENVSCVPPPHSYQNGLASWYGPGFHGKRMANGEPFDMEGLTVAHRRLPLGTEVCITNTKNGESIRATVTDRGPYVGLRIVDLSKRVADELGMTERGLEKVEISIITARGDTE